jgi:hypothetical protein
MKGTVNNTTTTGFLIQLVSTLITDSSNWRYTWTPVSSTWTQVTIPWSSFSMPSWGQGTALTIDQVLASTRALNFAIADLSGGTAASSGNVWDIDGLEVYSASIPTNTPTNSPTSTFTNTPTITDTPPPGSTNTYTPTVTSTFTYTYTHTPTNTITVIPPTATPTSTATPSQADVIDFKEIEDGKDTIVWPNPGGPKKNGGYMYVGFMTTRAVKSYTFKIYTSSLRCIKTVDNTNTGFDTANGGMDCRIGLNFNSHLADLAKGTYFYVLKVYDDKKNEAVSKIGKIIILY